MTCSGNSSPDTLEAHSHSPPHLKWLPTHISPLFRPHTLTYAHTCMPTTNTNLLYLKAILCLYRESMSLQYMTSRGQAPPRLDLDTECFLLHHSQSSSVPQSVSMSLYLSFCVWRIRTLVFTVPTPSQRSGGWGLLADEHRPQGSSPAAWGCWWLLWWSGCSGSSGVLVHLRACSDWSGCRKGRKENQRLGWSYIMWYILLETWEIGLWLTVRNSWQLWLRKSEWETILSPSTTSFEVPLIKTVDPLDPFQSEQTPENPVFKLNHLAWMDQHDLPKIPKVSRVGFLKLH